MNSTDNESKIHISSIIAAIFLVPIIEKILTPFYDNIINHIFSKGSIGVQFISSLFYSRISEGVYINIPFYIFIVIVSSHLIKLIWPFPATTSEECTCPQKECTCNLTKRIKCFFLYAIEQKPVKTFICVSLYILFILFILTTNFINKNIARTINNIEIVAPYINDNEYKTLKSNFHSMNSRSDFIVLYDSLEKIAIEEELILK